MENAYRNNRGSVFPLGALIRSYKEMRWAEDRAMAWYAEHNSPQNPRGMEREHQLLLEMQKISGENGVDFSVAMFPLLVRRNNTYPLGAAHSGLSDFLGMHGIKHVDLSRAVFSEPVQDTWLHPFDRKPNAETHRRIALSLADFMGREIPDTVGQSYGHGRPRPAAGTGTSKYPDTPSSPISRVGFYSLVFLYILFAVFLLMEARGIASLLKVSKTTFIILLLVMAVALAARLLISPQTHLGARK